MRIRRFIYAFAIIGLMFISCNPQRETARTQRQQQRQQERRYKESEKHLELARQKHYEIQTPETQQRMDETRIKSEEWHLRKTPFYKRWYNKIKSLFK